MGFKLPQLYHRKEFVSRIVRAEYDSKVPFLDDKYSDYYIECPKIDDMNKNDLPDAYHDLWDLCCIFRTKVRNLEEVIHMQSVKNPVALDLADGVMKTVSRNEVVNDTLDRRSELLQLQNFFMRKAQKEAALAAVSAKTITAEEMIIAALRINAPSEVIETMRNTAGITDTRLDELRRQVQNA